MRVLKCFPFIIAGLITGCASTGGALPQGAIQKGSLSNQKLIHDAMLGVVAKVATLGCGDIQTFEPYVLTAPQGKVGARYWRELWVVQGCDSEYPVNIRFSEAGPFSADYLIE